MADKKKLGCLPIAMVVLLVGAWVSAQSNPDEEISSEEPVGSTQSQVASTSEESPSNEDHFKGDEVLKLVCGYSESLDKTSRKIIKEIGDGSAVYQDKDRINLSVRTLRGVLQDSPELSSDHEAVFEEQVLRSLAISVQIEAVEIYDDLNAYTTDLSKVSQHYLRYEEVGDLCGF